jgi:thiol-disulfide isomerase/thioredoxin
MKLCTSAWALGVVAGASFALAVSTAVAQQQAPAPAEPEPQAQVGDPEFAEPEAFPDAEPEGAFQPGITSAPEFAVTDLDGNPIQLADLAGRPVIVNFWASWCPPCIEEFPLLKSAAERHADDGLVVIGIVHRDRSEAARAFMSRMARMNSAQSAR